jgi:hypothetical protein
VGETSGSRDGNDVEATRDWFVTTRGGGDPNASIHLGSGNPDRRLRLKYTGKIAVRREAIRQNPLFSAPNRHAPKTFSDASIHKSPKTFADLPIITLGITTD